MEKEIQNLIFTFTTCCNEECEKQNISEDSIHHRLIGKTKSNYMLLLDIQDSLNELVSTNEINLEKKLAADRKIINCSFNLLIFFLLSSILSSILAVASTLLCITSPNVGCEDESQYDISMVLIILKRILGQMEIALNGIFGDYKAKKRSLMIVRIPVDMFLQIVGIHRAAQGMLEITERIFKMLSSSQSANEKNSILMSEKTAIKLETLIYDLIKQLGAIDNIMDILSNAIKLKKLSWLDTSIKMTKLESGTIIIGLERVKKYKKKYSIKMKEGCKEITRTKFKDEIKLAFEASYLLIKSIDSQLRSICHTIDTESHTQQQPHNIGNDSKTYI